MCNEKKGHKKRRIIGNKKTKKDTKKIKKLEEKLKSEANETESNEE